MKKKLHFCYADYDHILLDMDGVLFDSNHIKETNIRKAASHFCDRDRCDEFVRFFVQGNGVPRESKIRIFFSDDESGEILLRYNQLNRESLGQLEPLRGVVEFLEKAKICSIPCHVMTGSDEEEAKRVLKNANLLPLLASVHGGPRTKKQHFDHMQLSGNLIYFGDSQYDYEFAVSCGIDFVFVFGHSSWKEGAEYLGQRGHKRRVRMLGDVLIENEEKGFT